MEINPLGQALSGLNGGDNELASGQLADTFDTFLTLLTQQLQNQDPLNPMDSQQFVSQLVEFSSVEQQINQNQSLESLLALQAATANMGATDYIGKLATVSSDSAYLAEGFAQWQYGLPQEAASVRMNVVNAQGKTVARLDGETGAGPHMFTWDGKDEAGTVQPNGVYRLEITALDAKDNPIETPIRVTDRVTGVDLSGDEVRIEMGGLAIPIAQVIGVRQAPD